MKNASTERKEEVAERKRGSRGEGARTALQHWHVQSWLTAAWPFCATAVEGASDKTATKRAAAASAAQPL